MLWTFFLPVEKLSNFRRRLSMASQRTAPAAPIRDRKSTRLNSSHSQISYAVFCLKKKKQASIKMICVSNLESLIAFMTQNLTLSYICHEPQDYLARALLTTTCLRIKSHSTASVT